MVAWSIGPRTPSGDEPHYLVIAQSLLLDGDLRIQNNHDRRDYAAYFDGTLAPDVRVRGRDGQQYSIHAPGVATLVLPLFAVFGYRGAQATLLDVDMAAEMTQFTSLQVLTQAGVAMLAQANQMPQNLLKLLQ